MARETKQRSEASSSNTIKPASLAPADKRGREARGEATEKLRSTGREGMREERNKEPGGNNGARATARVVLPLLFAAVRRCCLGDLPSRPPFRCSRALSSSFFPFAPSSRPFSLLFFSRRAATAASEWPGRPSSRLGKLKVANEARRRVDWPRELANSCRSLGSSSSFVANPHAITRFPSHTRRSVPYDGIAAVFKRFARRDDSVELKFCPSVSMYESSEHSSVCFPQRFLEIRICSISVGISFHRETRDSLMSASVQLRSGIVAYRSESKAVSFLFLSWLRE